MPWKKLLAWATGQIDEALRQKLEYVLEENPTSLLLGGRPTARKAGEMRGNGTLEKANAAR